MPGPCVAAGVEHRLASDLQQFVLHDGVDRHPVSFLRHTDGQLGTGLQFGGHPREHIGEAAAAGGGAQVEHPVARLHHHVVGTFQHRVQRIACRRARAQRTGDGVEAEDQPLHALQQRIVKLAGDALAFTVAFLQAVVDLPRYPSEAQQVGHPQQRGRCRHAGCREPGGLVVARRDRERDARPRLVPDAIVVGGQHAEHVVPGPRVGVVGHPARSGLLPFLIVALQPVAEAHPLRDGQAQGGVADLQVARAGGQAQLTGFQAIGTAIDGQRMDADGGRQRIALDTVRIDRDHAAGGGKPEPAVAGLERGRYGTELRGNAGQPIEEIEQIVGGGRGAGEHRFDGCCRNPDDPARTVQPQVAVRRLHDAGNATQRTVGLRAQRLDTVAAHACQSALASDPQACAPLLQRTHVAHIEALRKSEDLQPALAHRRDLVVREAHPHTAVCSGKQGQRRRPLARAGQVAQVGPAAVLQAVETGCVQRYPHGAVGSAGDGLHARVAAHRQGNAGSERSVAQGPDSLRTAQPHHAGRVPVGCRQWRGQRQGFLPASLQSQQGTVAAAHEHGRALFRHDGEIVRTVRQRGQHHVRMAEPIQAAAAAYPERAFPVLQQRQRIVGRQSLALTEAFER